MATAKQATQAPEEQEYVNNVLDDEASVDTYLRVWRTLSASAVYGVDAQNLISAARRTLCSR